MNVVDIANEIHRRVGILEQHRDKLKTYGDAKARAIAEYDKVLAIHLIGLKNGKRYEVDGVSIQNPPASSVEKIAKGLPEVYKARLAMELADVDYKSITTFIDTVQAETNALQSLNRHLDSM